ncbi:MAG: 3'-5' exoribonuclease [Clostridia bacterium]|nr:3'-5' exoribonuclease [Clostridia bacterium]
MLKIGNKSAFVSDVSMLDESLSSIKVHKIEIDRENMTIKYTFISDKTIVDTVKNKILDYLEKETPKIFKSIFLDIKKVVTDAELIVNALYAFVKNNYPSVSMWFEKSDVTVNELGATVFYTISLAPDAKEYFDKNGIISVINEHLFSNFCSTFIGDTKKKAVGKVFEENASEIYVNAIESFSARTYDVLEVVGIDEKEPPITATYIVDATDAGNYVLAGTISSIREKETKTGKPFYIIDFSDTTAKIGGLYFTKKNTIEKVKQLTVGQDIIIRGKMSYYGDKGLSLTIDKINLCKFPEDFTIKERPKKDAPCYYSFIKPEKATSLKVKSIFDMNDTLPSDVLNSTIVSVDIETTGTNALSDRITEIGAVKIENGKITEQWTTLINPQVPLSSEITNITGIDDEMLKDKPLIKDVIGDFLCFVGDAKLLGHNLIEFDAKFLSKASKDNNYKFNYEYVDTLVLARKLLPSLKNHKLNTLAEKFEIEFRHHRALSDAYATAEVFLELKKIQEKLKKD